MKKLFNQNPFLIPFLTFALICILVLSVEFFSIIHSNNKSTQEAYYQEKINILLDDFKLQLENLESMAFRFSLNSTYAYSVLSQKKYNEKLLLENFKNYKHMSPLTEELFLYYGGNMIFHVSGNTISLDVYLSNLPSLEKDIIISTFTSVIENAERESQILSSTQNIYVLMPFQTGTGLTSHMTILVGAITFDEFEKRIQFISGGLNGTISLYADNKLIYCNQNLPYTGENALLSSTPDGKYMLYYLPAKTIFNFNQISFKVFLILLDIMLILFLARIFAFRTFQPIKEIHNKYHSNSLPLEEKDFTNVLSEIDSMIGNAMSHYITATKQAEHLQIQIKQQLLRQLLNKTYLPDIQSNLNALDITMSEPFFFVISLSFVQKGISEEMLLEVQKEIEQLSIPHIPATIYAVRDIKSRQLWIICNLFDCEQKSELTDAIIEIAESYFSSISAGVGKTYNQLDKIAASWLESIYNLDSTHHNDTGAFTHSSNSLQPLTEALSIGSVENALCWLNDYRDSHKEANQSLLMLQYSIAEFIGEINKLSKRNDISLSNANISLLFSAKDPNSFYDGAKELILEYCDKYRLHIASLKEEQAKQICQYIEKHFMEYDISIDLVAEKLGISTAVVRDAILKKTNMMYKDYLIKLRIERAKLLLQEGTLSIAEVSQAIGYSSVSYFIRLFKNTTGVTPAKYVKKAAENPNLSDSTQ